MATSLPTSMRESIDSLVEWLHESATVASVFGEPIERDGKTVVPVARVAYGFGGGFGAGFEGDPDAGEGGGVGGGVAAMPAGALEITDADTRFVRYGDSRKLLGAAAVGLLLGLLLGRRRTS